MFSDSHISITASNDIKEICQPLFQYSNITLFEFKRVFPNGSYITLSSSAEFVKKLSAVKWTSHDLEIIKNRFEANKRYYPLKMYKENPACMRPLAEEFDINNGLLIKETCVSHQDNFRFVSQTESSNIYDYLFNNIDFIEKFTFYFKDKASLIIKKTAMEQRLFISNMEDTPIITSIFNRPFIKDCSERLKMKKYIFTLPKGIISLSSQELNAVKLLAKGYTIKEAAQSLSISPRTIEYYLKCARAKLKINSNRQLISTYWKTLSLA